MARKRSGSNNCIVRIAKNPRLIEHGSHLQSASHESGISSPQVFLSADETPPGRGPRCIPPLSVLKEFSPLLSDSPDITSLRIEIESLENWITMNEKERTRCSQSLDVFERDISQYKDQHLRVTVRLTELEKSWKDEKNKLDIKRHELKMKVKIVEDKRRISVEWRAIPPERKALIKDGHLYFVDRDLASRQLLHVHNQTYGRSGSTTGIIWEYGICANDLGCGKSEFAENYINHISQLPVVETSALKVFPLLCGAVTLHICLTTSAAYRADGIGGEILKLVKEEIHRKAVKFLEYSTSPREIKSFLGSLVSQSDRPIFLVIDEVAAPFFHPQYLSKEIQKAQTEKFKIFIRDLILPLLQIRGLFLLLCGKAPFLDWLGTKPNEEEPVVGGTSAAATQRIELNMIRPEKIVLILENTFNKIGDKEISLREFLNLGNSKSAEEYAEKLYQVSGGHPRTMCQILRNRCLEIEATRIPLGKRPKFIVANESVLCSEAIELLRETIIKFGKSSAFLLNKCDGKPQRLRITQATDGITYAHLLPPLRIGVELLKKNFIRLCIPDQVRLFVESFVSPLYDFLRTIYAAKTIPIDFALAFELLVAKALNMNFKKMGKPSKANNFFFNSPVFGNWNDFVCENIWRDFPKVTSSSTLNHNENGYTAQERGVWIRCRQN